MLSIVGLRSRHCHASVPVDCHFFCVIYCQCFCYVKLVICLCLSNCLVLVHCYYLILPTKVQLSPVVSLKCVYFGVIIDQPCGWSCVIVCVVIVLFHSVLPKTGKLRYVDGI